MNGDKAGEAREPVAELGGIVVAGKHQISSCREVVLFAVVVGFGASALGRASLRACRRVCEYPYDR